MEAKIANGSSDGKPTANSNAVVSVRTPRQRCRKVPRKENVRIRFSRNMAGEGNPRAYSNDLDSTACINHVLPPARILRCNGSSDEQPAAPQMRRLRSNSACLYADHAGRCYGGATLAYPIPVRHPKFHHGGGIGSLLCGSCSTIDPARYGIDWPRSTFLGRRGKLSKTKIEFRGRTSR